MVSLSNFSKTHPRIKAYLAVTIGVGLLITGAIIGNNILIFTSIGCLSACCVSAAGGLAKSAYDQYSQSQSKNVIQESKQPAEKLLLNPDQPSTSDLQTDPNNPSTQLNGEKENPEIKV